MSVEQTLNIFVDQGPDGRDISGSAEIGAWLALKKKSGGYLLIPACTDLGRAVMQKGIQVENVPKEAFLTGQNLSDLPQQIHDVYTSIRSLLTNNM